MIFVWRGDKVLLLQGSFDKKIWPGLYNGVGGHVERGEDVLTAARRELKEETGLEADVWLCGIVLVDAGPVGIGVFVFTGEAASEATHPSAEGQPRWVEYDQVEELPTVADVVPLLRRIRSMRRGDPVFCARSSHDAAGNIVLQFQN